jgi:hypothetical protein
MKFERSRLIGVAVLIITLGLDFAETSVLAAPEADGTVTLTRRDLLMGTWHDTLRTRTFIRGGKYFEQVDGGGNPEEKRWTLTGNKLVLVMKDRTGRTTNTQTFTVKSITKDKLVFYAFYTAGGFTFTMSKDIELDRVK